MSNVNLTVPDWDSAGLVNEGEVELLVDDIGIEEREGNDGSKWNVAAVSFVITARPTGPTKELFWDSFSLDPTQPYFKRFRAFVDATGLKVPKKNASIPEIVAALKGKKVYGVIEHKVSKKDSITRAQLSYNFATSFAGLK